jgi:hypothetical protein
MGLFSRPTFLQRTSKAVTKHAPTIAAVSTGIIAADIVFSWIGQSARTGYKGAVAAYEWGDKRWTAYQQKKAEKKAA